MRRTSKRAFPLGLIRETQRAALRSFKKARLSPLTTFFPPQISFSASIDVPSDLLSFRHSLMLHRGLNIGIAHTLVLDQNAKRVDTAVLCVASPPHRFASISALSHLTTTSSPLAFYFLLTLSLHRRLIDSLSQCLVIAQPSNSTTPQLAQLCRAAVQPLSLRAQRSTVN